jgi:hypothetical protein
MVFTVFRRGKSMVLARLNEVTLKREWEPQNVGQGIHKYSTIE